MISEHIKSIDLSEIIRYIAAKKFSCLRVCSVRNTYGLDVLQGLYAATLDHHRH
jgi:hypothetical protein